jgi:hypothetical protein
MKKKIVARNREHLIEIIAEEIELNGNECDLNHIDISNANNLFRLFSDHDWRHDPYDDTEYPDFSDFNGDISKWNVSHVKNMEEMFYKSKFNGDISQWDVSKVEDMHAMFYFADFNGDISKWDVSKVEKMGYMFCNDWGPSSFEGDLLEWKPYSLHNDSKIFADDFAKTPYWALIYNNEELRKTIDAYHLGKELPEKGVEVKRMKI